MNGKTIPKIVKDFSKTYPKFSDGRIDYTHKRTCAVITVFVEFEEKILLMKRSRKVGTYKGKWMAISGYYDSINSMEEKILEELTEETGITTTNIKSITYYNSYTIRDVHLRKEWIIYDAVIRLKQLPQISINWEHTEYVWINPKKSLSMDIVPTLSKSLIKVYNI
jgi:8-oxo-dGTP pyrophosphatase MutT (NUDIX family)